MTLPGVIFAINGAVRPHRSNRKQFGNQARLPTVSLSPTIAHIENPQRMSKKST
jgi:hypothetical protein